MKLKSIGIVAVFSFFFCAESVKAQSEYRAEVGLHSGVSYYLGDANSLIFNNLQPDYGMIFRYNFNERFLAQVELNNTTVTDKVFSNMLNSIDVCGAFNFFDFDYKGFKPDSRRYSTYIMLGMGMMNYKYEGDQAFKYSYIFGVGFKWKLLERLKLNIQWTHKLLLTDQMEGISMYNNPADLNGSNLLNNDLLSTLTIGLTYDVWAKKCKCYNVYR
jgi:hypothetical protein